jgi:uncharacterized membrane protein YeaQ/YmgE (transglycosylase-associated protein family)
LLRDGLLAIVLLALLGWAVVVLAFHLLWWALIGLVLGGVARLIVPGRWPIGILMTAATRVAASLLGRIVAHVAHLGGFRQFAVAVLVPAALVIVLMHAQRAGSQHACTRVLVRGLAGPVAYRATRY